jgi:hypothetical protein
MMKSIALPIGNIKNISQWFACRVDGDGLVQTSGEIVISRQTSDEIAGEHGDNKFWVGVRWIYGF